MKARSILLTVGLCFAIAPCFAQSPQLGTWKLNEAKSHMPPGSMVNTNVVYEAVGDQVKVTTDGTYGDQKPVHTEWTGKFDGKGYPLAGDSAADSRSYKMVNPHTLTMANMQGGKVTSTGRIVVSADGKSRTLSVTGTDPAGKKFSSVAVYNKE